MIPAKRFYCYKFSALTVSLLAMLLWSPLSQAAEAGADNVITWAGCGITKKSFMKELAVAFEAKSGYTIKLEGGGATRGLRDAASGDINLGGSCRMALPEYDSSELFVTMHPVAWDALAIILHKENPVNSLSTEQVKQIYLGKITNWKQVGGEDAPIKLYARKGKISGVGYAIRQYMFQDSTIEFDTSPQYVVRSSGPLEKAVVKDRHAMGVTGVSSARKRDVKIIGLEGKEPSFENIRDGLYGFYRPLYLVTGPSSNDAVQEFVRFASSEEGRQVIRDNGTVPYADAPKLASKLLIYGRGVR